MSLARVQNTKTKYGKRKRYIIYAATAVITICSILAIIYLVILRYTPPSVDKNQKAGTPEVDESFLYGEVKTHFDYGFSMAANLYQQENHSVKVYLTNPADANVYLQCVITENNTGKTLYKSGLIEPGKYLESMKPVGLIKNEMKEVEVNVYAYEMDTWYSKGTTTMEMIMQAW